MLYAKCLFFSGTLRNSSIQHLHGNITTKQKEDLLKTAEVEACDEDSNEESKCVHVESLTQQVKKCVHIESLTKEVKMRSCRKPY